MQAEPPPPLPKPALRRIALVMIARNEAAQIARALHSARPWVDELWVLDTGSTDATVQVARRAGAQVAHFQWVDDFSAARNAALALTQADWRLILDADEWIASGGEALAALRHQAPAHVGQVRIDSLQAHSSATPGAAKSTTTATTTNTVPSWISRVLPAGVHYAGRVHEQPQHSLPVQVLPLVIGHGGYLPEPLARKAGRNARLLLQALAAQPHDAYLWYQLGKDHDCYERYAEAITAFESASALLPPGQPVPAWEHDLLVRRLHALKRCQRHAEGVHCAQAAMARWSHSPDLFFAIGDLLLDWAADEPTRAPELLPMIEDAWRTCLHLGERPDLEGAVAGRGSHLAQHNLDLLHAALGPAPDNACAPAH